MAISTSCCRSGPSSRGHHAALPYRQVQAFLKTLRERPAVAALALEFTILTAARTGEVLGARWDEIDLEKKVWTIPAARMKAAREHRIPLVARPLAILQDLAKARLGVFVFPGQRSDRPLSSAAMEMLLRRLGEAETKNTQTLKSGADKTDRTPPAASPSEKKIGKRLSAALTKPTKPSGITVHGFRSSFRDWAGNETHFARELAEAALAHVIGDKAEQAYRRSDALEKRRALMEAWAAWCEGAPAANVLSIRKA